MLSYTIDRQDRITAIAGPWDEFAAANGAPELTRARVEGTPLFGHICGAEPAEIWRSLLRRARSGRSFSLGFRCDAPDRRRFLRIDLEPAGQGAVRCSTRLEREEQRDPQPLLDPRVPRTGELLVVCSWCRRVRVAEAWHEVEEAVARLDLLAEPALPTIDHAICEACAAELRRS